MREFRTSGSVGAPRGAIPGGDPTALALWGREVGRVFEDGASTDIVVRYGDEVRADRDRLAAVRVPTPSGAAVPLSALASIQTGRAPNYIMRENVRRRVVVTANVSGRDLRSVAQDVRSAVEATVTPPLGVRIEYAGQFEQEEEATQRLLLLGLLVGIGLIVGATLRSGRRTAIVLANLPLALAGGVVGVYPFVSTSVVGRGRRLRSSRSRACSSRRHPGSRSGSARCSSHLRASRGERTTRWRPSSTDSLPRSPRSRRASSRAP